VREAMLVGVGVGAERDSLGEKSDSIRRDHCGDLCGHCTCLAWMPAWMYACMHACTDEGIAQRENVARLPW
jgi:hypothetical protein